MTTYESCIDWLFDQFPAYQNIGVSAYKPDLGNIISLCAQLDIDYNALKYVHVAGTNGKGSTSSMLASVLMESNYKTGLFTSPHILDFRERIKISGEQISEYRVIEFCNKVLALKLEVKPSFFEITWALALTYFIENSCDICVIETGLGGRLDSTNIITPLVSVITNVSIDHVAILGDTIDKIAFEKAGIIKNHVPVIIGETTAVSKAVFTQKADISNSKIYFAEDFTVFGNFIHEAGSYQYLNERTVRMTIRELVKLAFSISEECIDSGILNVAKNTGFRGRFEIVNIEPLTFVDVAHNEDGITKMLSTLKLKQKGKLHIIYGTSADKDLVSILALFPKDASFYFTEFSNFRSAKIEDIRRVADEIGLKGKYFSNVDSAFSSAQLSVNKEDTILITGSFFLVSDFF